MACDTILYLGIFTWWHVLSRNSSQYEFLWYILKAHIQWFLLHKCICHRLHFWLRKEHKQNTHIFHKRLRGQWLVLEFSTDQLQFLCFKICTMTSPSSYIATCRIDLVSTLSTAEFCTAQHSSKQHITNKENLIYTLQEFWERSYI